MLSPSGHVLHNVDPTKPQTHCQHTCATDQSCLLLSTTPTACILQEQKVKKAARQAKREPVPIGCTARYVPSQTYSSYGHMGTPLHEVSSYASSTHMGSPGYYSPVHPGSGEKGLCDTGVPGILHHSGGGCGVAPCSPHQGGCVRLFCVTMVG